MSLAEWPHGARAGPFAWQLDGATSCLRSATAPLSELRANGVVQPNSIGVFGLRWIEINLSN